VMRRAVVMCPDETVLPSHLNDRFQTAAVAAVTAAAQGVSGATEFLRASELFQEQSANSDMLDRFGPAELDRLLHALHGIEAAVLSALRGRGGASAAQRGLKETEAETIKHALDLLQWNITETARALGIGRNTLYRKIKQFRLSR
ncbi:MAG TPA: helix-turn-helix domain-containing protein, partial [Geobacteraceae bacterium]